MNPLKYYFLLLSLTGHSQQLGPRGMLFFDPLEDYIP